MSLYRPLKKHRMADFLKNRALHATGASPLTLHPAADGLHPKDFAKIPSFSLPLLLPSPALPSPSLPFFLFSALFFLPSPYKNS